MQEVQGYEGRASIMSQTDPEWQGVGRMRSERGSNKGSRATALATYTIYTSTIGSGWLKKICHLWDKIK